MSLRKPFFDDATNTDTLSMGTGRSQDTFEGSLSITLKFWGEGGVGGEEESSKVTISYMFFGSESC